MKYYVGYFLENLRALIDYIPLIWKDRDWDFVFFLLMMKFKLKRMRNYFLKSSILCKKSSKETVDQIKKAEQLIDLMIEDDFIKKEYAAHNKKWGKSKVLKNGVWGKDFLTESQKKQEQKEIRKIFILEEKRRSKTWKDFFSILEKDLPGWWD